MAELGSFKDRNAQRLKKADRLKRAQSVQLADPMIGYARNDKPHAPSVPAENPTEPKTRRTSEPASGNCEVGPPAAPTYASRPHESEPVRMAATEPRAKVRAAPSATASSDVVSLKLTFQFSEAILPRVEQVAMKFGVKPDAVLVKASKAVKVKSGDFKDIGNPPRLGPTFRYTVSIPEAHAEAWIQTQDPLRIKERPGSLLRIVALNAFDRATVDLLQKLENEIL